MYRDVEVYCWTETVENVEERRGNQVRRGQKYNYASKWVTDFVESRNFKDRNYDVNVRPDILKECF